MSARAGTRPSKTPPHRQARKKTCPICGKPLSGKPLGGKPLSGKPLSGRPLSGKSLGRKSLGDTPQDQAYRPFCSQRCADIDLSRWLDGRYAIPGAPADKTGDEDTDDRDGGGPG